MSLPAKRNKSLEYRLIDLNVLTEGTDAVELPLGGSTRADCQHRITTIGMSKLNP